MFSRIVLVLAAALALSTEAAAQCSGSVKIVSPQEGATVNSHFQINATASSSCSISSVHVYIDNHLQFVQFGQAVLSGKFNAGLGSHKVVVQAFASDGAVFRQTVHVTINKTVASTCKAASEPTVNVCLPVNLTESKGSTLVHATAASSASPIVSLSTFVNGKLRATSSGENATEVETALSLGRGLQNINIVARTSNGSEFHNESNVQIVSGAGTCQAPFISSLAPAAGDVPEFPPFLAAADAAACSITAFQIYVDNKLFYTQSNQKLFEGRLTISPGQHSLVLQATNSQGVVSKKALTINVTGMEEPTCLPATDPGVTICQAEPVENRYVIVFVGTPASPASSFTALRIYVDNAARATFHNFAAQRGITFLKMSSGVHKLTAVAWTANGKVVTNTTSVTVP